ncbi:MAG: tetratricopeptide repeat protein [bacterium]
MATLITEKNKSQHRRLRDLYLKALMERARIFQFTGNYTLSYRDWKTLRCATKEPKYRYEYYRGLSVLHEHVGRFHSSAVSLEKALVLCKRHPELVNKAMIKSMQIRLMLEKGDHLRVISSGCKLLNKKDVKSLAVTDLSRLLTNIGNAYLSIGNYDQACLYFLRARNHYKRINNLEGLSTTENNLALVYWKKGDYRKALGYSRSALAIRTRIGHRYGISATLNNLGLINDEMGRYEEALSYYEKALGIFKELNDTYGMTIALSNIGSIYGEVNGDLNKAIGYYKRSLELSRLTGDTYCLVEAMFDLAEMHWCNKDYMVYEQIVRSVGRLIKSIHSEELNIVYTLMVIKMYVRKKLRSKVASLVRRLIRQASFSKNYLLHSEAIASIVNLMYDQQMFFSLPEIDHCVKEIEKRLGTVESPLRRSKILRGLVKYYLLTGNRSNAVRYYRLWKNTAHKFKIKAQNLEIDKIGAEQRIIG